MNATNTMLYADKANHILLDLPCVNANREKLSLALNSRRLDTHETSDLVESFGVCIEGRAGVVRPADKTLPLFSGRLADDLNWTTSHLGSGIRPAPQ